jgi:hypothetical protein
MKRRRQEDVFERGGDESLDSEDELVDDEEIIPEGTSTIEDMSGPERALL